MGGPRAAQIRGTLAMVLGDLGEHTRAVELFEEAGAQLEATLGPTPELANVWINQATALNRLGRPDEALAKYERALAILETSPDQLALATALNNLGEIYYSREVYDAARRYYERSLAILERISGPDHPDLAFPLVGLARVLDSENRHEESIATYERVVRITTAALGPNHRLAAVALNGMAQVQSEDEQFDAALATLDREQKMLDDMTYVRIDDRLTLATVRVEILLARGDPQTAIPELERWVTRAAAEQVEPGRLGSCELTLALALQQVGRTADARTMVARALGHIEDSPAQAELVPIARALQAEVGG